MPQLKFSFKVKDVFEIENENTQHQHDELFNKLLEETLGRTIDEIWSGMNIDLSQSSRIIKVTNSKENKSSIKEEF